MYVIRSFDLNGVRCLLIIMCIRFHVGLIEYEEHT